MLLILKKVKYLSTFFEKIFLLSFIHKYCGFSTAKWFSAPIERQVKGRLNEKKNEFYHLIIFFLPLQQK